MRRIGVVLIGIVTIAVLMRPLASAQVASLSKGQQILQSRADGRVRAGVVLRCQLDLDFGNCAHRLIQYRLVGTGQRAAHARQQSAKLSRQEISPAEAGETRHLR